MTEPISPHRRDQLSGPTTCGDVHLRVLDELTSTPLARRTNLPQTINAVGISIEPTAKCSAS